LTRHQRGFTQFTRPVFPSPAAARMERAAASAFPRASHPADQEPTTHVEVGTGQRARTWNYSLNVTSVDPPIGSSLTTCDLASHDESQQRRRDGSPRADQPPAFVDDMSATPAPRREAARGLAAPHKPPSHGTRRRLPAGPRVTTPAATDGTHRSAGTSAGISSSSSSRRTPRRAPRAAQRSGTKRALDVGWRAIGARTPRAHCLPAVVSDLAALDVGGVAHPAVGAADRVAHIKRLDAVANLDSR
jgi:hypothetical protein